MDIQAAVELRVFLVEGEDLQPVMVVVNSIGRMAHGHLGIPGGESGCSHITPVADVL